MSTPFKMKGFSGFGNSPLNKKGSPDKSGHKFPEVAKKLSVEGTIKRAGHVAAAGLSAVGAWASAAPQATTEFAKMLVGKKTHEDLANLEMNPTHKKFREGFSKHVDKAASLKPKKSKKKVVIPT